MKINENYDEIEQFEITEEIFKIWEVYTNFK